MRRIKMIAAGLTALGALAYVMVFHHELVEAALNAYADSPLYQWPD
jgi:hypothetical protein